MRHVFFILLRATPAWLRLSRAQRRALSDQHLAPLLQGPDAVRLRWFDAEAFTADCSDLMMVETGDPGHHYIFIEHLRDSPMLTVPYFELRQIIPAIEDGYQAFEQAAAHEPSG